MIHWSDEELTDYILGFMPTPDATRLEVMLRQDKQLKHRVAELSELLSCVPLEAPPLQPNPALLGRLEASLDVSNRFEDHAETVASLLKVPKAEALSMLAELDAPDAWKPGALPATEVIPVPNDDPRCGITWLKMAPGMAFPDHHHMGEETVFVLQGDYLDEQGTLYPPGSVLRHQPGTHHEFRIGEDGPPFICLAIVMDGIRIGDTELTRSEIYGV